MFLIASLLPMALFVLVMIPVCAGAQNAPTSSTNASSDKAVSAQLVALRDSFVKRIKAEGFEPSLPAPIIILNNEPSYGAYDRGKNIVYVAVWEALEPDQRAQFANLF